MSQRRSVSAAALAAAVVIVVVVAAVALYFYSAAHRPSLTSTALTTTSSSGTSLSMGTVMVFMADPPANGTNVTPSAVYVTVSSIMVHSTSGSWITISNRTVTVRLTQNLSFLAGAKVPAGNYTEVRLVVSNVTITVNGANVSAKLPSGTLKIPIVAGGLMVKPNATVYLVIRMGPHITKTGSGTYIMRPVVTAEAYSRPPTNTTTTSTTT